MNSDLQTLANLVSTTDQWEQAGALPQELLREALPLICALLPSARGLRLWLMADGSLQSAGSAGRMPKGKPQVPHHEALQAGAAHYDQDAARWTVSLRRQERLLGALEVMMEDKSERAQQDSVVLRLVADLWTSLLEKRAAADQAQRRTTIYTALAGCRSFADIARVLGEGLLHSGQRLVLNIALYDDKRHFIGLQTVAAASRNQVHDFNHTIDITLAELGTKMRRALQNGDIVIFEDVQAEADLSPRLKTWRENEPIIASCVIPLRSQGRVLGLLSVNTISGTLDYTDSEWRLFDTLANQIGGMSYGLLLAREAEQNMRSLQRLAQSKALVSHIAGQMQQQPDIAGILDLTVSQLGQALGARRARIRLAAPAVAAPPTPEHEAER
jgi:GAF domain-containing protein